MLTLVLGNPDQRGPGDLLATLAGLIHGAGVPLVLVPLDPTLPDDHAHERRYRAALARVRGPVILGGFSLGARIAARLAPEFAPLGLLGFAYPFHAPGRPSLRPGLDALMQVQLPTRLIQGTRDPHGSEAEVRGYALPARVKLVWLRDGNHRFVPRARSGLSHAAHLQAAAAAAIGFARGPCP